MEEENIARWHEDFQRLHQDWREWLRSHQNYKDFKDAWQEFQAQEKNYGVLRVANNITSFSSFSR
jgi:hypothetical protein